MMEYKLVKNAAMKRILFMLFAVIMSTAVCHAAMSNSKVRKETRFLTDKMAYELNLNTAQYNRPDKRSASGNYVFIAKPHPVYAMPVD